MGFGSFAKGITSTATGGLVGGGGGGIGLTTLANPAGIAGTIGGTALLGGADLAGTYLTNEANAKQAELNRKFQERMSNTAHQRQVKDLRAAGLNPILSAKYGGSSTPGGAQATMQNLTANAVNSAKQVTRLGQELRNMKAQERHTGAQTIQAQAQADSAVATAGEARARTRIHSAKAVAEENKAIIETEKRKALEAFVGATSPGENAAKGIQNTVEQGKAIIGNFLGSKPGGKAAPKQARPKRPSGTIRGSRSTIGGKTRRNRFNPPNRNRRYDR